MYFILFLDAIGTKMYVTAVAAQVKLFTLVVCVIIM